MGREIIRASTSSSTVAILARGTLLESCFKLEGLPPARPCWQTALARTSLHRRQCHQRQGQGHRDRHGHGHAQLIAGEDGGKQKKKCGCLPDTSAKVTPLQQNLEKLGSRIGVLAIVVCIIICVSGVAMDRKNLNNPDSPACLYMILIIVTLAVAAIPEGTPLCVTISCPLAART